MLFSFFHFSHLSQFSDQTAYLPECREAKNKNGLHPFTDEGQISVHNHLLRHSNKCVPYNGGKPSVPKGIKLSVRDSEGTFGIPTYTGFHHIPALCDVRFSLLIFVNVLAV